MCGSYNYYQLSYLSGFEMIPDLWN